jgi:hypothetical protein
VGVCGGGVGGGEGRGMATSMVTSSRMCPTWYVSELGSTVAACSSSTRPALNTGTTCSKTPHILDVRTLT